MPIVIDRPPVGTPPADTNPGRDRPLLTLRLSDGHSWAHEFGASNADDLRDGCFEAWVACRLEWQRRAGLLPEHQTIKRAQTLATMPRTLVLHVLDTSSANADVWINANQSDNPLRQLVVLPPGTATNAEAWVDAPWADTWLRCLRAWWAAAELTRFLGGMRSWLADAVPQAIERGTPPAEAA